MWCVAICHDVENGGAARSDLFAAHVAHNVAHMGAFLFTGPLANDDGASGVGDAPRLIGSIYCFETDGLAEARRLMEADPFMKGAWRQVDYYRWRDPAGAWSDPSTPRRRPGADFRCYVAGGFAPLAIEGALMNGPVESLGSTGAVSAPLAALAILTAEAIGGAKASAPGAGWIAAAPIAIGKWVGVSSPADLAGAA